jgi:hypothetical protein
MEEEMSEEEMGEDDIEGDLMARDAAESEADLNSE